MANNHVQVGHTVTAIAPTGGVVSGQLVVIGALALIPHTTAAEGEEFEAATSEVWSLPKKATDTPAQFAKAYWDDTNKHVTTTATGNTLVGVFMNAQASGTDLADVRLNGVSV